jgi:hypothetical protein
VFEPSDILSMDMYIKAKMNHIINNLDETNTSEDTQSHLSLYYTPTELSESPHLSPGMFINELAARMDSSIDERKELEVEEEEYDEELTEPQTSPYFLTPVSRQRSNLCRFTKHDYSMKSSDDPCAVFKSATKVKEAASAEEVSILLPVSNVRGYNFSASLPQLSSPQKENYIAVTIEDALPSGSVAKKPQHETAL